MPVIRSFQSIGINHMLNRIDIGVLERADSAAMRRFAKQKHVPDGAYAVKIESKIAWQAANRAP